MKKLFAILRMGYTIIISITSFANAETVTYQYNAANQLVQARHAECSVISYTYDANGNRTSRIVQPCPEIAVKQGTTVLPSGSGSYAFAGTVPVGSSSAAVTFTIENSGTGQLILGSIQSTGTHPADFTVTQPLVSTVAPGATTTFTVTFVPTITGSRNATISIANNDSDENPYTFSVTGTGQAAASQNFLLWTK